LDDETSTALTRIIAEVAGATKAKSEMMLSNPELLKKRISGMNESEALSLIQSAGKDKSEAIMQMLRQRGVDLGQ
jgi:hypothetical protein